MSAASVVSTIAVAASPPLDWLRPGALGRLLDPRPPFVSGLSRDFIERRYGRSFAEIAKEARQ